MLTLWVVAAVSTCAWLSSPCVFEAGSLASSSWWWWESVLAGLAGGEFGGEGEGEAVGLVGVAEECVGAVGDELFVVVCHGAHRGEVRDVVGAACAAGDEVMDLEALAHIAAGPAAVPVAEADGPCDLG